jgi:nucleoside phosphorylase
VNILVTFALENEFAPWRNLRRFRRVTCGWDRTFEVEIGDAKVRVVLTGVGEFAVNQAMAHVFEEIPDRCIASGFTGSLKPEHRLAEVLVARNITTADGTQEIQNDPDLLVQAANAGARVVEKFLTSRHIVSEASEKQRLGIFGDAIDMESISVLTAANHRAVRSIAIRAVSDGPESDLPLDFERVFNGKGTVSVPRVVGQLARRPARVFGLIRLAHNSERAAVSLTRFLDGYVQLMACGPLPEIAKAEALAV